MCYNSKQRLQCDGGTYLIIQQTSQCTMKSFAMKQWYYINKDTSRIEMKRISFTNNVKKNHGCDSFQLFYLMNFQSRKYPFYTIQYHHTQHTLLMILLGSLGCVVFWNSVIFPLLCYRGIPIYGESPSRRIREKTLLMRVCSYYFRF